MSNEESKSSTSKTATATSKVVTIITTRGEKQKVPFDGSTWSELKALLEKGGKNVAGERFSSYDLGNMKCVESVTRHTLEHPDAVVPNENFNLFLMPVKSKSGAGMNRTEAYAKIKGFIEKDEEKAKAHFNEGKNYTTKSTDALIELIESYRPGTKKAAAKEKGAAIADVVTSVKTAKEAGNEEDVLAALAGLSDGEKIDVIIKLLLDLKVNGVSAAEEVVMASAPAAAVKEEVKEKVESPEEKAIREAKEADEAETAALLEEMGGMSKGFKDVQR